MGNNPSIFTELEVSCNVCPDSEYGKFDNGEWHIQGNSKTMEDYVTKKEICTPCPYGAICKNGIVIAKPNFWGTRNKGFLLFYPCFSDHCEQSNSNFTNYDICLFNRVGPICTKCMENFTEALFSSSCIKNENCHDWWILTISVGSALAYVMFLLYQKDFSWH